jgi:hypothetical protein
MNCPITGVVPGDDSIRDYGMVTVSDGVDGEPAAMNPNEVEVLAANDPLYEALRTATAEPLLLSVRFHI